ncbi:MAG: hypothetical protein Q8906_10735 [Bacillota bacterium]|nr:hypothetical protein [Bacillota bacterium]MDP4171073.1 hypothetical protein [Bacillota bacterium]
MWAIIGICLLALIISIIEVPSLVKKKLKKEMIVFFCFLSIAVTFSILLSLQINIPSILKIIEIIYAPVSKVVFSFLQ